LFGFEVKAFAVQIFKNPNKKDRFAFDARILLLILLDKTSLAFPPKAGRTAVLIRVNPSRDRLGARLCFAARFTTKQSHSLIL
jgi:hypothetical protein